MPLTIGITNADHLYLWVRKNRGACARIARDHDVSKEFVRRILYGIDNSKSAGLRIEIALIEAGAPFIQDRISSDV